MKSVLCYMMLFCAISVSAQPQAFNYQGVARDGSGSPLVDRNISLRLSILQGAFPGSIVYQENHNVLTNKFGVFNTEVGRGHNQFGLFEDIDWGIDNHYIQIEMDPEGGTNFTLLGKSQLLSVPYALFAGKGTSGDSPWQLNEKGIHYNEGFVGIGTPKPEFKLSLEGNNPTGDSRTYLKLQNLSASNRSFVSLDLQAGPSNTYTTLQHIADTYDYEGDKFTGFGQLESSGRGVIVRASKSDGIIKFLAGGNSLSPSERMRIAGNGYIGIGTEKPTNLLTLNKTVDSGDERFLISVNNNSLSNRSFSAAKFTAGDGTSMTTFGHNSETYDVDDYVTADFGGIFSSGAGIHLTAGGKTGVIKFLTSLNNVGYSFERMRISADGNVGIGTKNPEQKLTIEGNDNEGSDVDYLFLNNTSRGNRSGVLMALSAGDRLSQTTIGHHAETYDFDQDKYTDFGQVHSSGAGLILRASGDDGIIKFLTGKDQILSSIERMRLTTDGNLGVGTEKPAARIQVADGDIYIEDINNGVIMKSPNGNCWRMTINDDGTFRSTLITCPN